MLRLRTVIGSAAVLAIATLAGAQSAANCKTTFISQPGNKYGLAPEGINQYNTIVGFSNQNAPTDFIRYNDATFGKITVPGAADTVAMRRNSSGTTVGYYVPTGQTNAYYNYHGWVNANGTTTILNYPNSRMTMPSGINKYGTISGTWIPATTGATEAFQYKNGTWTRVGTKNSLYIYGINDLGTMVGTQLSKPYVYGVIYASPTATEQAVNYPNSDDTVLYDINNNGIIVGTWDVTSSNPPPQHGMIYNSKTKVFYSVDIPNAVQTFLTGINGANTVVGYAFFRNANGTGTYTRGFYAACTL